MAVPRPAHAPLYRVELTGNSRQRGLQYGKILRAPIARAVDFYRGFFAKHLGLDAREARRRAARFIEPTAQVSPRLMSEYEGIAEVDGVDVVFAGPLDLSASLGHIGQTSHPSVLKFLEDFPRRVARCGKASGITLIGYEPCKRAYEQGYRFINIGNLAMQGMIGLTADLKKLRQLEGES